MRWGSVSESDCDNNLHVHNFMQIPGTQSVPVDCTIPCRTSTKHLQEFLIKMRKKGPWKISVWLWLDFVWILNSSFILTIHLLLHFSYSFRILSKILETFPWNADFYMVWLLVRVKSFLAGYRYLAKPLVQTPNLLDLWRKPCFTMTSYWYAYKEKSWMNCIVMILHVSWILFNGQMIWQIKLTVMMQVSSWLR